MKTGLLILALASPIGLMACSTANAASPHYVAAHVKPQGNWVLNPRKCPDLVEDYRDRRESRRDESFDRNRRDVIEDIRDRRESRRDEAVTVCPASAWDWHGPKYSAHHHVARPVKVKVYYNPHKKRHYHKNGRKHVTIRW